LLLTSENNQIITKAVIRGGKIFTELITLVSISMMSLKKYSISPPRYEPTRAITRVIQKLPNILLRRIKKKKSATANPIIKYIIPILK